MASRTSIIQSKHQILLDDTVRMEAYRTAIAATVRPGDVVADLGCGLGALSLMACEAGAARVHAIEVEPATLALARQTVARSPHRKRIQWHAGLAQTMKVPERVDVIISETFGSFGLDENTLPLLRAACKRWLKADGRMIPQKLILHAAPLMFRSRMRDTQHRPETLPLRTCLGPAIDSPVIDFATADTDLFDWSATLHCTRPGELTGFGLWFTTQLTPDIAFTTAPDAPPTHWRQGFLPIEPYQLVRKNTQIDLQLRIGPDATQLETVIEYAFDLR